MKDRDHAGRTTAVGTTEMAAAESARSRHAVAAMRNSSMSDGANEEASPSRSECSIDQLCIDTIRTLSMDAVQQADSGHPGTPMALAPVVYTLWQRFLRFDPEDPAWPNRDRFVLSNGHASMLLYAMLHLTGVKSVTASGRARGHARRHQALPPARQQMPGPSRIPAYHRRRDDDRAARSGLRDERRHGDRRTLAGATLQSARLRDVRLRRLCAVRRRRHDGGRHQRSRLARRAT